MSRLTPGSPHSNLRVFTACLLSFMMWITPVATLAASVKSAAAPATSRAHASTEKAAQPAESQAATERAEVQHSSSSPGLFNMFAPAPLPVGAVTATLKDIFTDADGDGKADKGQTITYEAVITNTTGASITGTTFTDTPDANTTLVNGSIHASPVAFDDTYNWVGNTVLDTSFRSLPSITSNDTISTAPDTIVLNATPASGPSHGAVTITAGTGHFVYTPTLGYSGDDSFTYTISNSADGTLVGTGTVTIHMPNRIWYLQGGASGDGRSNTPSGDPATISGLANAATDVFYVFSSGTTLNGPFTLNDSQQLLGQGVALNLAGFGQLFAAGSAPTIGTTVAATNSVTLGSGNTLSGFNIGTVTGTAIIGANVGALTINTLSINTTGAALDLTGAGVPAVSITLGRLTSSGGAKNVNLVGLGGSINLGDNLGALSGTTAGASNHAFAVSGGNATITFSGTITKATTGNVVNISAHTANTITLSGAINGNGSSGISLGSNTGGTVDLTGSIALNSGGINAANNTGGTFNFTNATKTLNTAATSAVNLTTNTGATFNFTNGGLNIDTTSGNGFVATGGGTVSITGSPNTIDTTTGTALNISNTLIGTNDVTFEHITSNGGTSGIILNSTGTAASNGGLIVTGTGGTCTLATPTCSGGTIQSKATGIMLTSTRDVSLTRMYLHDFTDWAVRGSTVVNYTMANTVIAGTNGDNDATDDGSMNFTELTGSASITSCNISGGWEDNIKVVNTTGTLNRITIDSTTIGANGNTFGDNGILLEATNSTTLNATITNNFFTSSRGDHFQLNHTTGSPVTDLVFTGNTITNSHPASVSGAGGIRITSGAAGSHPTCTYNISNNTMSQSRGAAIGVTKGGGGGTFTGTISGNTVGVAATANSGSLEGSAISIVTTETGSHTVTITGNFLRQYNNNGIILQAGGSGIAGNGQLKATVQSNTISNPGNIGLPAGINGIHLNSGVSPGDSYSVCLTIGGAGALQNNMAGSGAQTMGSITGEDFRFRNRQSTTDYLTAYGGANNDDNAVAAYLKARNSGNGVPTATGGTTVTNNTPTSPGWSGAACPATPAGMLQQDSFHRDELAQTATQPSANETSASNSEVFSSHGGSKQSFKRAAQPSALEVPGLQLMKSADKRIEVDAYTKHAVGEVFAGDYGVKAHAASVMSAPLAPVGPNVSVSIGTLPDTKSVKIKFQVTINNPLSPTTTPQVQTQGTVTSSAGSVQTDDPDTVASPPPPDTTVTLIAHTDLTMQSKTDGVVTITPGSVLTYTLSYKNSGRSATGVVLTETVPVGTTSDASNAGAGWVCAPDGNAGSTCTFSVGSLAFNAAVGTKTFKVVVNNPAAAGLNTISNTASIADDGAYETDINPADNSKTDNDTAVNAVPDLNVTSKSDGLANTTPNSTLTYTINYSNSGNQGAANVVLTETVPVGTTYVAAGSSVWSCSDGAAAGTTCTISVGSLGGGGASGNATFVVHVNTPAAAGLNNIANTASIDDDHANGTDPTPASNSKTDTDILDAAPDLSVTKTPDVANASANTVITYTLNYSNTGNQGAAGVVLTETVPANTTFNAGASTAGWVCAPNNNAGSTCTLAVGSLAAGGNGSAAFAVTVNSPVPGGTTQISNTATIADNGANGTDTNPANNTTGPVTTPVCQSAITVTNTNDSGAGSLRQAILDACPGATITFNIAGAGPHTVSITSGPLVIAKNLTITGPLDKSITINGNGTGRVFSITDGTVAISNLTVSGAGGTASGGGLFVSGASTNVTLTGMLFTGNTVVNGGGGGVGVGSGTTVNIRNSTISGNSATFGGGIYNNAGTLNLLNDTITNNLASGNVGGGPVGGPGAVGGGIDTTSGTATNIKNSIVAGNSATSSTNIAGTSTDQGNNLLTGDPRIGALANNGGPTRTHALLIDSPALDAGDNASATTAGLTLDQRGTGFKRILDSADTDETATVDIGAYEANPMIQDIADQSTNEDVSITCLPFNVGDNTEGFSSITATSSNQTVVPDANLAVSAGPGPGSSNRCLAITLPANQSGVTTITVTVTGNNTRTISDTFQLTVNSVNDTPTTLGIPAVNVNEDAADTLINLPARFGDVEDGAAALGYSVQGNTNPSLFTSVSIGAGNILTLDYAPNTSGTSDITIRATDSGALFVDTTFTVTVTAINDAPTLDALGNATIAEDATTQTVNLSGITAGPGESQTLTVTATSNNTAIIPNPSVTYTSPNATGSISYAPIADANGGPVTITVTVTDNGGTAGGGIDSFQRTFTVTVTEVNDAPVATDDTPSDILEDSAPTAFSFASLLANDSKGPANENGQTLNITGVSNFVGGTAQIVGTDVVFTPTPNYSGPASFEYTVTDNGTTNTVADPKTDIGKASFNITAVNDEPSFTKGADQSVNEDAAAQTVNGWATAISAGPNESGQVVDFVVTNNNNGLFSVQPAVSATGVLTYTLAADANGAATVSVKIHDNGGILNGGDDESPVQTFTITVAAINDAPSFQIPSNPPAVNEDAPAQTVNSFATNFQPGPVTATDETGQTLVGYTVTQTGTTGNLTFTSGPSISNAGTLTYTPTSNTSGTATFNVVATDSGSGAGSNVNQSAPVSFTIQVTGQNDAPVLDNSGNMSLSAISEDVANASNPGTLVSDIILSAGGDRITDVDAGAIEGIAVTAVSNANGAWQYSIDNGTNWLPFNTPDATTARLLAANATTRVRFIPNANFNGTVNPGLTFRAWDQTSGTNGSTADVSVLFGGTTAFSIATETASITVNPVNDTPTANAQVVGTNEDTPVGITLTGTDVETASGAMTYNVTVLPLHGTLTGTGANRTYTPNPDYNGPDSFQFTVTDTGDGASPALTSAAATVTINVGAINDAPVANAQSVSTNEDTAKSITLTGTDIDTPQGSLSFIIVTGPAHGTIDPGASPNRTYTPTGNYNGPDSFTFKINDGSADSNTATVTITVNPVNDTPTADAQAVSTNEDTPKAITLTGSDTETAQANLVFNVTVQPTHGVLSGTGANRTYTPTGDYNGPDSFKFTVTDTGDGSSPALTSAEATVSITVNAVNDAPVNTVPGAQSVVKNGALPFSAANSNLIAIADVDAGAGPVQVTLTATNGRITLSGITGLSFTVGDGTSDPTMTFTGTIANINAALSGMTFSPTNGYDGPATLQIVTNDQGNTGSGGAQSDTDTINIDVLKGGVLQFSAATYTVSEGGGTVTITVSRTDGSVGTSHVDYATSNGTATAGQDYTATSGTLTFDPGVTTQTFNVPITNDTIDELDETVNLTLSNVTGSSNLGAQITAVLTITDNDPTPTLAINDATVTEGNSGTVNATFTVSLSAASGLPVSVNYQTADGTATAPSDYTAIPSTALNFAPGETTKTITVLVKGDTLAEADENFFVNLSGAVNATIADNQGQGNIVSDDTPLIEFSSSTYSVQEDGLRVFVRVNRKGDLSKVANVDYATSDPSGLNNCDQVTGIASSRCDYATTVGTLRFAAGESFKDIAIPIVNDVYVEGGNGEVFTITLSNISGAELGSPTAATVTINDPTDNGTEPNPIDNDSFFIRQLYIDFLGREPEPGAINNWLGILNHCAIPTDCDRNAVAQGFVRSTEFQERGYFVYRFYSASLGRIPLYSEFIPDTAKVSGFLSTSDLEANKLAYIAEFMNRPEFKNLYDVTLNNPTAYVDKLLATAVLPNHPRRAEWIAGLTNNTLTRAQVLRQFVESTEVFTKYFNEAFIVMNYFGFLRRNPDAAFQAWIQIFNQSNDDKGIINGFLNSAEYRHRFGQ